MKREEQLYQNFVEDFARVICQETEGKGYSDIVFLCIGTDRVIGDTFGPLVGNQLSQAFRCTRRIHVIGTLAHPVNSQNSERMIQQMQRQYQNPFVIAIDSALTAMPCHIGSITVDSGPLCIGRGLRRNHISVGDMNIKGVVARNCNRSDQNFCQLQNTSLQMVMHLADTVAKGIYDTIQLHNCE